MTASQKQDFDGAQHEWEAALDAIRDAIFICDKDFRIVRANQAYAHAAGMDIREVIGRLYWEVFPKRSGPLTSCLHVLKHNDEHQSEEITLDSGAVYLLRSFAVRNKQGDYIHSVHIMEDITEKKRLQDALEESTERYRSLFEGAPDAVFLADAETGRLLDANSTAEQLIGRTREEIISLHQSQLHPATAPAVQLFEDHVHAGLTGASPHIAEIPVVHADGHEIPTEISAQVLRLNGKPVIQGVFRNISARIKAEQALRDSEETFRAISGAAQDAVLLLDDAGKITYWNPAAGRIFGYSASEALGRDAHLLFMPPRYHEAFQSGWPRFRDSGTGVVIGQLLELEARRKDGSIFPVEVSVSSLQLKGCWHAVGIVRDISARKRAEDEFRDMAKQLRLSLSLLEEVVESVPIRAFWKDRDLKYLGCNTLFAKDAGLDYPQQLIGKTDFDMGWRDQAELYREDDRRVMESGISKLGYEEPQTTPDGKTIWVRTSKVPLRGDDQEVIGVLGIYDDITEQKLAKEQLLRSESRLKEAQAVGHLGSWEFDLVKDALWWSDENCRIFGVEPGTRGNYETFINTVHPDDRSFVNKAYSESVKNRSPYDIEHRLLMQDGSIKWVNERCKTYYSDDDTPLRSVGTTLDLTERKRAEGRAARLGRVLNSSTNEVYVFDAASFKFVEVNEGACRNLGYSMEELQQLTPLDLKPEYNREEFDKLIAPLRSAEREMVIFETIHRRKDGSNYPIEGHLQFLAHETPPLFLAVINDISERLKAQENLRNSEASLAEAQRIAHLGNWALDLANNKLSCSNEFCRIFEIDKDQTAVTPDTVLAQIHPADRPVIDQAFRESVEQHSPFGMVFRLALGGGRIKYVRTVSETYYDDDGRPLRSVGTVQDITTQELAEQALNRSNRALRALSSCNAVLIHADDEDKLLQNMCRVITDTGGYRFAWIGFAEHDEAKCVCPVAYAGFEQGYLDTIRLTYADNERGRGPVGRAIRSAEPVIVRNINSDSSFTLWREAALERGYASVLALPLRNKRDVFGTLTIYAGETNAFDDEETRLLAELADDLAFGIISMRTGKRVEQLQTTNLEVMQRHKQALVDAIRAIAVTMEKRDPYTAGHQQRVADLTVAIGHELGLSEDRLEGLRLGATIHDIGKIYVPAEILNRPGRLTSAEFEIIKSHSQVGFDILKDVAFPWPVAEMVLQHHERLDGSGYPCGLKEDAIILEARIMAVADVVEAITAHRPYRPALGIEVALAEIEASRGKFYDTQVVDVCLHLIRDKHFSFDNAN
jgi:PAS domain S-box-containing protein